MPAWTFIRHGQAVSNAEGWIAGHIDAPLSRTGEQQARQLLHQLASRHIDRVYSSDLRRASETARLALGGRLVPWTQTSQLRERHCGAFERRNIAELRDSGEMRVLMSWWQRPDGGESQQDLALRSLGFLASIDDGTPHTVIVAHGMLIRGVLGLLDHIELEAIGPRKVANAEPIQRIIPTGTFAALRARLTDLAGS